MDVMVIEDEPVAARAVENILTVEGFNVHSTDLGEEGLYHCQIHKYDLILLDLDLPDMHGSDVLKELRAAKVDAPILIMSGVSDVATKVRCLSFGADDYITKPFHVNEFVARIDAVVRRSRGLPRTVIRTGKLTVDLDAKVADFDGTVIPLTGTEYAMLELLSLRKGKTLTKAMLFNLLYAGKDQPLAKIIDVYMCKLRRKLALACGCNSYIETVWGSGYMLREPKEQQRAA